MVSKEVKYRIEIVFKESFRGCVKERLNELKKVVESYHMLRDYNHKSKEGLD